MIAFVVAVLFQDLANFMWACARLRFDPGDYFFSAVLHPTQLAVMILKETEPQPPKKPSTSGRHRLQPQAAATTQQTPFTSTNGSTAVPTHVSKTATSSTRTHDGTHQVMSLSGPSLEPTQGDSHAETPHMMITSSQGPLVPIHMHDAAVAYTWQRQGPLSQARQNISPATAWKAAVARMEEQEHVRAVAQEWLQGYPVNRQIQPRDAAEILWALAHLKKRPHPATMQMLARMALCSPTKMAEQVRMTSCFASTVY